MPNRGLADARTYRCRNTSKALRIQALNSEGKVINEFPSIAAAGAAGFSSSTIKMQLHHGGRAVDGLLWRGLGGDENVTRRSLVRKHDGASVPRATPVPVPPHLKWNRFRRREWAEGADGDASLDGLYCFTSGHSWWKPLPRSLPTFVTGKTGCSSSFARKKNSRVS